MVSSTDPGDGAVPRAASRTGVPTSRGDGMTKIKPRDRDRIHRDLLAWADIKHHPNRNARGLGYPSSVVGGKDERVGGGVPGSREPTCGFPTWVKRIDFALDSLSLSDREAVRCKYERAGIAREGQRIALWSEITGKARRTYYDALDRAYIAILGFKYHRPETV